MLSRRLFTNPGTRASEAGLNTNIVGGTIVCGVRASLDSRSAVELACALGARLGLRLVLVHVVDEGRPGTERSSSAPRRRADGEHMLNAVAREIGIPTEKRVVLGDRAEGLALVSGRRRC